MPTHQLLFGYTLWGMRGLFESHMAGIQAASKAGFSVIEADYTILTPETAEAVQAHGMLLVIQCYPQTVSDLQEPLYLAKQYKALQINAHAGTPFMSDAEAAELVNALIDRASGEKVPILFETHRGRLTQDLFRTCQVVKAAPRMRFTLDASHYIVCHESFGPSMELVAQLDPLLDRIGMMHGRISNGQQIQVDPGDGTGDLEQVHVKFWAYAMRRWRQHNSAGSSLVFTPEPGPPNYAILDTAGNEVSDRWQQALVIKQMAAAAWKMSSQS